MGSFQGARTQGVSARVERVVPADQGLGADHITGQSQAGKRQAIGTEGVQPYRAGQHAPGLPAVTRGVDTGTALEAARFDQGRGIGLLDFEF